MNMRGWPLAAITAAATLVLTVPQGAMASVSPTVSPAAPATLGTKWSPDVAVEPFAGDVFQVSGSGDLIPVDPRTTPDGTALFNLAGEPLGETWGQFRAATASSQARIATTPSGDATDVRITLSGLFPNGVYSLFYRTFVPDSVNPVCSSDPTIALTARDPEQSPDASSFVADSSGAASFYAHVAGRLIDAQNVTIALVYHFDGKVYGAVPNHGETLVPCRSSFGADAMRQLLIFQK